MALLTEKGYRVQPFKCGPDYIDTKFHEAVCHRPSINLDTFMATPEHVSELFDHYGQDADVCIVEGMMGKTPVAVIAKPLPTITPPNALAVATGSV